MTKLEQYAWDTFLVALIVGGWFCITTAAISGLRLAGLELDGNAARLVILFCLGATIGAGLRYVRNQAYGRGFDDGCDYGPNGKQFEIDFKDGEVPF